MTKLKATLVAHTQPCIGVPCSGPESFIAYAARVSSDRPKEEWGEDYERLLSYCFRHKHFSVFEMADAVVEIEAPRDISRQLLRHRSFCFQEFCISGDSKVTVVTPSGRSYKKKISDLYKRYKSTYWGRSNNLVRVYDEDSKSLVPAKIKEVFETGVKPVFEVKLEGGKSIKATKDHKFLTLGGFKRLEELSVGDFVGVNGVVPYQEYHWLNSAKMQAIASGTGVQGIADMAGVSYHTIRKWLKINGLQFTKKEVAKYTNAWNKGLPKEQQPQYGRVWTQEQRDHHAKVCKRGKESNLYVDGSSQFRSWREYVSDYCYRYKNELLLKQGFKCTITGVCLRNADCEVDHIQPVSLRPDLAFEKSNLQVLSKEAHRAKSTKESVQSRYTATYKPVVSIKYVGEEQTYDMEIDHESHNYVANGIITHNSQRYSDQIDFTDREWRHQDHKNRQNSLDTVTTEDYCSAQVASHQVEMTAHRMYETLRSMDIAKECARVVLPEGLTMSKLFVKGSMRSWMTYLDTRLDPTTQKEHRDLAALIKEALLPVFPTIFNLER